VAVLIDRRVDPGQRLDLTLRNVPLESAFQAIADRCGLGTSRLGDVVYLGPPSVAVRLRPIASELQKAVKQLPAAQQRKLVQARSLGWEELSTPRDLLAQLGLQSGIEIVGLERVPHDLWAAADLPPLSLMDRLTLIAVQYGLGVTVAGGGARLELAPLPDDAGSKDERREPTARRIPAARAPGGGVSGSVEQIRIQRMSVEAEPVGMVLRQLSDRLGLELRIDEKALSAAGISLDQRVSVTVENASVDELLRRLLKSTGISFRRRRNVVEIMPAG
jgi:hypothetical protein